MIESRHEKVGKAMLWVQLSGELDNGKEKMDGSGEHRDLARPSIFMLRYVQAGMSLR